MVTAEDAEISAGKALLAVTALVVAIREPKRFLLLCVLRDLCDKLRISS
jgi:hypothetical protein